MVKVSRYVDDFLVLVFIYVELTDEVMSELMKLFMSCALSWSFTHEKASSGRVKFLYLGPYFGNDHVY